MELLIGLWIIGWFWLASCATVVFVSIVASRLIRRIIAVISGNPPKPRSELARFIFIASSGVMVGGWIVFWFSSIAAAFSIFS